jgi:uncharacterized protein
MLAQSAARAGHPVAALDLFNDLDTARWAVASQAVAARSGPGLHFDRADLLRLARRLCPPERCLGLVYGAGFEDDTDLLRRLAQGRRIVGNAPALVRRLKDPAGFFGLLDRLRIPFPEWSAAMPASRRGWLYKRRGGTGGDHVIDAALLKTAPPAEAGYFQRRRRGRPMSLLLLADGSNALVAGISLQLTLGSGPRPHMWLGAAGPLGPADLPRATARRLHRAAEALVEATGLVGCNSLDFLLDGESELILELNPRPSATLELYDPDWPQGLFDAHLQACAGHLPSPGPVRRIPADRRRAPRDPGTVRGHAIVYNDELEAIPAPVGLPPWCSDLSRAGSRIASGAPVCTVRAEGASLQAVRRQLRRRARLISAKP